MIDLPSISPLAAEAAARLAPRLPLLFDAAGLRLCAELSGLRKGPPKPDGWMPMAARIGAGGALLYLDPALLPDSVVQVWPEAQAVGMPEDLLSILRGVLLGELTELVHRYSGERPEWTSLSGAPGPHAVTLRRATCDGELVAMIALDDAGLDWLARRLTHLPVHRSVLNDLPVVLTLRLDAFMMTPSELGAIGAGDVVLLEREPHDESDGLAVLACGSGGTGWRALLSGGVLTNLSTLDGMMDNQDEESPVVLDDLPMEVACEVARITLPLARLREFAEGQVLDLGADATASVSLRVNGHVVAVGELVRIADRVGVRLTEVRATRS